MEPIITGSENIEMNEKLCEMLNTAAKEGLIVVQSLQKAIISQTPPSLVECRHLIHANKP